MTCPQTSAPFRCPTFDEVRGALLALLPRGRAWGNHDGGPWPHTVLYGYWSAVAALFYFLHERLCALRLEFWCATKSETHDLWMREYGLPDPCDPFPDLCAKVAALGGQRCEYFQFIASRAGWVIECLDYATQCGSRAGCGLAGTAQTGFSRGLHLVIKVYTGDSPAFIGRTHTPPHAGRMRAGQRIACAPDISGLQCLIERIAPAHVEIIYNPS